MNLYFCYTIIAICMVFYTVSSEGVQRKNDRAKAISPPLPINSKFFDPLLDDAANLQMIDGEYGDESNTTGNDPEAVTNHAEETVTQSTAPTIATPASASTIEIFKIKKGQEKFFGLNLLDWLKPMLGGSGLGYGGLYGAQYYGLGNHYGLGLGRPSGWNFPFYNYPYFNYVKKADTEHKTEENNKE